MPGYTTSLLSKMNAGFKAALLGAGASAALLVLYFLVLTAVSGWGFTLGQFSAFWPFILTLTAGFGVQIGLYNWLRNTVRGHGASGTVVAATGATSGGVMVSCCAHYLVNILPILGITGLVTLISQYQVQLFWLGIVSNLLGIWYLGRKVWAVAKI